MQFRYEVIDELARRLGHEPERRILERAESQHLISDVLDQKSDSLEQEAAFERLETFVRAEEAERLSKSTWTRTQREFFESQGTRVGALARILAAEARGLDTVRAFRREMLRGRLVIPKRERVYAWLKRRREERDRRTTYAEVILTEDGQVERILKRKWRTLLGFYVRHNGAIGRLRAVVDVLTERFPWSEEQAVYFSLCDTVPRLSLLKGRIHGTTSPALIFRSGIDIQPETPSLDRISVKVPPTTSPKVVMNWFAELRRDYYGVGENGRVPGVQPLTEKHAELAVFAFEHNDGRSWLEALSAWNETYGSRDWGYSGEKPFARDSRAAYKTVTGRDLGWKSGRGPNKKR